MFQSVIFPGQSLCLLKTYKCICLFLRYSKPVGNFAYDIKLLFVAIFHLFHFIQTKLLLVFHYLLHRSIHTFSHTPHNFG